MWSIKFIFTIVVIAIATIKTSAEDDNNAQGRTLGLLSTGLALGSSLGLGSGFGLGSGLGLGGIGPAGGIISLISNIITLSRRTGGYNGGYYPRPPFGGFYGGYPGGYGLGGGFGGLYGGNPYGGYANGYGFGLQRPFFG